MTQLRLRFPRTPARTTQAKRMDEATAATDEQLVALWAQRSDRAALAELVRRRHAPAFHFALRVLGDEGAAQDVATDSFLSLMRSAATFDASKPFGPWWGAILANSVRDAARRTRTRRRHEEKAAALRPVEAGPEGESRLQAAEVASSLRELPTDTQLPIVLHYWEGMTHDEIARTLDCPKGTVASRIRRGLEQLKARLEGRGKAVASVDALLLLLLDAPGLPAAPAAPSVATLEAAVASLARKALATKLVAGLAALVLAVGTVLGVASHRASAPDETAATDGETAPATAGEDPAASPVASSALAPLAAGPVAPAAPVAGPAATPTSPAPGRPASRAPRGPRALAVRVRDAAGLPVAGAEVEVQLVRAQSYDPIAALEGQETLGRCPEALVPWQRSDGKTDGTGTLRLALEPDVVRVRAVARHGLAAGAGPALAPEAEGDTATEVAIVPPEAMRAGLGALLLTVTGGGHALPDTDLSAEAGYDADPTVNAISLGLRTDGSGRCAVHDVPPGWLFLGAFAAGFAPRRIRVEIVAGKVATAELALDAGAEVAGRIEAAHGESLADVRVWLAGELAHREQVAVEGGHYRLRDLAPGDYDLHASAAGCAQVSIPLHVAGSGPQEGPTLVLGAGARIGGRVVDGTGAPVAGASVSVDPNRSAGRQNADAASGPDGRFRVGGLQPGAIVVTIDVPPPPEMGGVLSFGAGPNAIERTVQVEKDRDVDLGDLVLDTSVESGQIVGTVVDDHGNAISGAIVALATGSGRVATSDAAGAFVFEKVERGTASLYARLGTNAVSPVEQVTVSPGTPATVRLTLVRRGRVRGRALLPPSLRDDPAAKASLAIRCVDQESTTTGHLELGDADGQAIPLAADGTFRRDGLPPGQYELTLSAGGATVEGRVAIAAGAEATHDLSLAAASARLALALEGFPERVANLSIVAEWGTGEERGTSAAEGRAPSVLVAPGTVTVTVHVEHNGLTASDRSWQRQLVREVAVTGGETAPVSIAWPSGAGAGSIAGKAPARAPSGAAAAVILSGDGISGRTSVSPDGTWTFDALAPGRYQVQFLDSEDDDSGDGPSVSVEVKAGQPTTLPAPLGPTGR